MTNYLIFLAPVLLPNLHAQKFNLDIQQKRIEKGKADFEKFSQDEKYNSPCWQKAMSKLENGCRKMTDTEQSVLALQFANCHLERSGLCTYECDANNFKSCTREMSRNIIAFQSYTEFFTHLNDICFYLQSEIWRENAEATVEKLSSTSSESLDIISRSMAQQKEVLSAQEKSLKNQRNILQREKVLTDTLIDSAEAAREQKAVFSETFKHLFDSVEKLSSLQKMLLGEFIGLQSYAFYVVAPVICYLFTSTPRTASARLPLFVCLLVLIVTERLYVKIRIKRSNDEAGPKLSSEEIHAVIWSIRKTFLLVVTAIVVYFIVRFKDYTRVNYAMLQQIQDQICEMKKLRESQLELKSPRLLSSSDADFESTLVPGCDRFIRDVTEQLELSIIDYESSMAREKDTNNLKPRPPAVSRLIQPQKRQKNNSEKSKGKTSTEASPNTHACAETTVVNTSDTTIGYSLSESRYNLRSRRSFQITNASMNQSDCTVLSRNQSGERGKGRSKSKDRFSEGGGGGKKKRRPAFFSSDDEVDE